MINNKTIILITINLSLLLLTSGCLSSHSDSFQVSLGKDKKQVNTAIFKGTRLYSGNVGFILYDPQLKKIVQSHNSTKQFIPASTLKVATVSAALNILGPDYRFKTTLHTTGSIKNNTLIGSICLKGTGDPWLSVTDFLPMIEKLKKMGIKKISGKFYYDDSALVTAPRIDDHMEYDAVHNTSLSALSTDYNSIYARWIYRWYNKKYPLSITLIPKLPFIQKTVSRAKLKDDIKLGFKRNKDNEIWLLSPELKKSGWQRLPVKQPSRFSASLFKKLCAIHGIELPEPARGTLKQGSVAYTHFSKKLLAISETTIHYSINLMTELLLMQAAKKLSGSPKDLPTSAAIISDFYKKTIKGVNWNGLSLVNGSGLSSRNRISPEQLLALYLFADSKRFNNKAIESMLPVSGWKWSLRKRFIDPAYAWHVWAKTGGINYATGLAGIVYTHSGKRLFFTFFINDLKKRMRYEKNPNRRSKKNLKKVAVWTYRQRSGMDKIIKKWIKTY